MFGLSDRAWATLTSVLKKFRQRHSGVEIFVFGSRASGQFRPHSDLDILIKGDQSLGPKDKSELAEAFAESDLPIKIDLVWDSELSDHYRADVETQKVPLKI